MKTKTSDHSVFCYVHSAGGETELRPWPEDYSSYALTAKTARRQGGLNIRKYAKKYCHSQETPSCFCQSGAWEVGAGKDNCRLNLGGGSFPPEEQWKKLSVVPRYVPIFTETPSEAQNSSAALKKQDGLFQLSGVWRVCLQEHPRRCNNKHLQLQELC